MRHRNGFFCFRQLSGGNYFIAIDQVLSSLQLQRLKLFDQIQLTEFPTFHQACKGCQVDLSEEELNVIDECLLTVEELDLEIASALYYACGYIAFKEQTLTAPSPDICLPESEFTQRVSRGGLCHPSLPLFGFAKSCFYIFIKMTSLTPNETPHCFTRFNRMFVLLGESYPCDFQGKLQNISRRLVNIFYKGLIRTLNESLCQTPSTSSAASQRKIRKLSFT